MTTTSNIIVTKDFLQGLLDQADSAKVTQVVGRALVVLFNNQTETEKSANTTQIDNGVGFTGADAYSGALTAKSFIKNKTLQPWQVDRWVKRNAKGYSRLAKYWKQLDEAAQIKRRALA